MAFTSSVSPKSSPHEAKPLAEVRADIERELRTSAGAEEFRRSGRSVHQSHVRAGGLAQPAAHKLGLKITTQDNLTRPASARPNLGTPRVIEAMFCDDSLKNRRNTQAIEIGPNTLVSARVLEHRPAAVRPLDEGQA